MKLQNVLLLTCAKRSQTIISFIRCNAQLASKLIHLTPPQIHTVCPLAYFTPNPKISTPTTVYDAIILQLIDSVHTTTLNTAQYMPRYAPGINVIIIIMITGYVTSRFAITKLANR